jgi:hypothetical protein
MAQLARLMEQLGGDILFAGDLAYDSGTLDEFRRCFDPAYGRFRSRSWAVPGNHEYVTAGAAGYFTYFGDRAGPTRSGYYALRLAGWHVLMLNSMAPMGHNSAQFTWVQNELAASPARCTLAVPGCSTRTRAAWRPRTRSWRRAACGLPACPCRAAG